MRVLIFGAKGWLGGHFRNFLQDQAGVYVIPRLTDVTNRDKVEYDLKMFAPDWVINAAGMTHGRLYKDISGCEEDEAAKARCWAVNVDGAVNIARACRRFGAMMLQLSTGSMYNGSPEYGFSELDVPTPVNHYYRTKDEAEHQLFSQWQIWLPLIMRPMLPFNDQVCPKNLIYKLSHYTKVAKVKTSVTYVPDLLNASWELMKEGVSGVFNVVCPEPLEYEYLLERYCELVNPGHEGRYQLVEDLPMAVRRSYAVLSVKKLERYGIQMTETKRAIDQALLGYKQNRMLFPNQASA